MRIWAKFLTCKQDPESCKRVKMMIHPAFLIFTLPHTAYISRLPQNKSHQCHHMASKLLFNTITHLTIALHVHIVSNINSSQPQGQFPQCRENNEWALEKVLVEGGSYLSPIMTTLMCQINPHSFLFQWGNTAHTEPNPCWCEFIDTPFSRITRTCLGLLCLLTAHIKPGKFSPIVSHTQSYLCTPDILL